MCIMEYVYDVQCTTLNSTYEVNMESLFVFSTYLVLSNFLVLYLLSYLLVLSTCLVLFTCNSSLYFGFHINFILIYIFQLNCTFFHLMNNQMNIFVKLICPRKFQQTDRVQSTAPVQIQQEDLLHLMIYVWSHALLWWTP